MEVVRVILQYWHQIDTFDCYMYSSRECVLVGSWNHGGKYGKNSYQEGKTACPHPTIVCYSDLQTNLNMLTAEIFTILENTYPLF